MSLNTNSLITSQSGIVGAIAAAAPVVTTSDVTNINSHKQINQKWHKNNNKKLSFPREANSNERNDEIQVNENVSTQQSNTNNKKNWSNNNNKKKPFQNKNKTPAQPTPKRNSTGQGAQSTNAAEYREDLVDSPLYALNSSGSTIRSGSKKTNLNHLLNFTYESPNSNENYYEYEKYSRQFWSTKFSKSSYFSKEQFLQANCQFVVKNTGDYTTNLNDPDLMVEWDKIEEIIIESHDHISCPICLYPPQIGKIAKCGHIFNWSCILHYLSLSDKSWRKCPICYESIYKNDLKSVRINKFSTEFKIGDEITFNLMFKSKTKNSTLILPNNSLEQFKSDEKKNQAISLNLLNSGSYSQCAAYLKLHSRSAQEIYETIVKREKEELTKQFEMEKNEPEVCFVSEAIELLNQREANLKLEFRPKTPTRKQSPPIEKRKEIQSSPKAELVYTDAFENLSIEPKIVKEPVTVQMPEEPKADLNQSEDAASSSQKASIQQSMLNSNNINDLVYFYQSADGQRIYINQLNARCLVSQYTSFNQCPNTITGKIIAYESYFMTDENRKRFKYLSHLPLHSEFKIVELNLKEPFISQATLDLYEDEIEERKQFRLRKELREKRLADKAAASLDTTPYYYTTSAMNEIQTIERLNQTNIVDYTQDFPEASTSPPTSSGASVSGTSVNDSNSEHLQQVSFAQMLKHQNSDLVKKSSSANTAWPTLETNTASNVTAQSSQLTNGWLTMVKLQSEQTTGKSKKYQGAPTPWAKTSEKTLFSDEHAESIEEIESMPAPLYAQSFFSSIDESLKIIDSKKASLLDVGKQLDAGNENATQNKLKKKKKTKHLLFSTS